MPFQVRIAHFDVLDDQGGAKHNNIQKASAVLEVTGATTVHDIEIVFNSLTVNFVEGVAWTNAASDEENARRISVAINQVADQPVEAVWRRGTAFVELYAKFPGKAGQGITAEIAVGANITVDGGAGPTNFSNGTGSASGPEGLQAWLDANVPAIGAGAGDRIAGSLQIKPLFTESSSFLVVWEEN